MVAPRVTFPIATLKTAATNTSAPPTPVVSTHPPVQVSFPPSVTTTAPVPVSASSPAPSLLDVVTASPAPTDTTQHLVDPVTSMPVLVNLGSGLPPQASLPIIADNLPKETIWHKIARFLHLAK
jgi:hypothetical protein